MEDTAYRAIAVVGVGAILPEAPNAAAFWKNVRDGRYSINEVTPDRWDPSLYYDPDPHAPDKTYSKIGGWVREAEWNPIAWHLPIPPRVADSMDDVQKWAVAAAREALVDFGYPDRPLDLERTAVILGNAMAGERHYVTTIRVLFPELARELSNSPSFESLPADVREHVLAEYHERFNNLYPEITEDTMPGELANCMAGRIANLFNFHGPNFVTDAACASAMAAMSAAVEGLVERDFDAVITGGIDRNMGVATFTKFCKIGALSATGTRPYADGADGFVMGEGAALFILKRLEDAEKAGDKIYAVLRGIGGSSDGRGKGITAPNPVGQRLAIERAWKNAGLSPATAGLIEGHGTSTRVGDVVEVESLSHVLGAAGADSGSIPLGSVKSNIGHLKGAAGGAGVLKAVLALHDCTLPPSLNFKSPNPNIDFGSSPFYVNTELKPWPTPACGVRRAGVSAFGFGGTNFHVVLEQYVEGRLKVNGSKSVAVGAPVQSSPAPVEPKRPLRGALLIGANSISEIETRLRTVLADAEAGRAPAPRAPFEADLRGPERIAIDYADAKDLASKIERALKAIAADNAGMWKALRAQGIFRGSGPAPKVAFLYTGQGSQYVNMLDELRHIEPIVADVFTEADRVSRPLLGKPLSQFLFADPADPVAMATAEEELRQTAITQPAVLTVDEAFTKLFEAYGIRPDMVMGHSLGEYGALVAAKGLPFEDALIAVSARGREMSHVAVEDCGWMVAVFAPIAEIERILESVDGYVVIANVNSRSQAVIGGGSEAVERAMQAFLDAGYNAVRLPVSHAFHTTIVAPASKPMRRELDRLRLAPPELPIVANVDGQFYPSGPDARPKMLDILARQIASPVQFVTGLETLYAAGARVFVETGPKKALQGFVDDVLGDRSDVASLFSNHPKTGAIASFNQALCGLYAAGHGTGIPEAIAAPAEASVEAKSVESQFQPSSAPAAAATQRDRKETMAPASDDTYSELGHLFADFLDRGMQIYGGRDGRTARGEGRRPTVVVTGAAIGLPGTERIFDDSNVSRILHGQQFIDLIPNRFRRAMLDKHITRLVKRENGGATFDTIEDPSEVIKLAARGGEFDLGAEFGVAADRLPALDVVTRLAIGAGIDALRDAGIPLVLRYKTTTKNTQLPDGWGLPATMRDDTGVIFASAFPGMDSFAEYLTGYHEDHARRQRLEDLEALRPHAGHDTNALLEIDRRIAELREEIAEKAFTFDRRFLFRVLAMGHSQFAELIGARGPNTQINAACASTTMAMGLAEDWIRAGRCRRVVIVSADDVTGDNLMEWIGAGFLASGAAATDDVVENAATPFDRRRHGMILGMGAAALVVEDAESARERGIRPICELLGAVTANSAFHGTRLDVNHISDLMERLVADAEARWGLNRAEIAPRMVFVSHETYTPARGGSAAAEVHALRRVFGDRADDIVVANTKGFTGHPMGVGIEDVVAVKVLETGIVPPVANFKEIDPELGALNLSKGGAYPVEYALRLGAGFGSQISMSLERLVPSPSGDRPRPENLGFANRVANESVWTGWLEAVSGYDQPDLEVVQRTLRIKDQGAPARAIAPPARTVASVVEQARVPAMATPARPAASMPAPAAPPAVAPAPMPAAGIPIGASAAVDEVRNRVLALVVEKTGYPEDMLDLELDLEADLGVDTVKQAELFAAIRAEYDIPRDENLKLRDFPTIAHAIQFVYDRRPDLAAAKGTSRVDVAAPAAQSVSVDETDAVRERVLGLVVEKTGYPKDMLDLDLDLEADLGVDTVKQAELFAAIRGEYDIPRDENLKLRDFPTIAHAIQFVYDRRPDLAAAKGTAPIGASVAAAPATPMQSGSPVQTDAVREKVLELVVEKTGYPKDMLDLDLDLEADLGVDTVKQAELFAAIRGEYDIPRDENLKLRDFPTISHAIQFVYDRRPDLKTATPAVPATAAQPVAAPAVDTVHASVLGLVAEKTGYPQDMLALDLDLEADLGIDTVKQAEIFAAARGLYGIPRDENLKLRDFPTLAHVIQFVRDRMPAATAPAAAAETAAGIDEASAPAVTVPRRVPVPVLRPALDLCVATGITLGAGARVVVMPDEGGVGDVLVQKLLEMGVETLVIVNAPDAGALEEQIAAWLAEGPINGVYWLPALNDEGPIGEMDLAAWREALRVRVKLLSTTMRALYETIDGPATFLVSGTRLGGKHGYDAAGATAPLGGAVTGFTKSYKRERPETLVKAVDFTVDRPTDEIATLLVGETLSDPGAVEIGYSDGLRWTVGLAEKPVVDGQPGMQLSKDSVFVVTGAAGSIVSAITADLAEHSGGTFYLLDLVPQPDPNDPDIQKFAVDRDGLRHDIFERRKATGERVTPAMVERDIAGLERAHAALTAIQAVEKAGGVAHYISANLLDADAVARAIDTVRADHGRIDVLLHAGGLEISKRLRDKDAAEYDLVFDVKSDGWLNLLRAIGDMPLGATVAFSSIAGRFGNAGQTDYSAANDLLCKMTSSFRTTRPETRGIVIDWTAWDKIGMASRGSIPAIMAKAGIDMLDPETGVPFIRHELTDGGTRGEVVVAGRLGGMIAEFHETGGIDCERASGNVAGPMLGRVASMGIYSGLTVETTLDPKVQPFLFDHQIEAFAVLPGVMGLEGFAELARLIVPDWSVTAIEDVEFLAPFKFYRSEPRTVILSAQLMEAGGGLEARCRLVGHRTLPGQPEPQATTHFTARVVMSRTPNAFKAEPVGSPEGSVVSAEDIYRIYFHGPAYKVLDAAWRRGTTVLGRYAENLPVNHVPPELELVAAPRLVELCFQTAGIHEIGSTGSMGLPNRIETIEVFPSGAPIGRLCAVVTNRSDGTYDAHVVDEAGTVYLRLTGYRTIALGDVPEDRARPLAAVMASSSAA